MKGLNELEPCLREAFGVRSLRLVRHERIKPDVHRLHVEADGEARAEIAKWSDPAVARRCVLVARRWLPAVGLQDVGPPLLAVAAEASGAGTWHVYDDLRGRSLSAQRPIDSDVNAAVDAIARVHTAFAEDPLIPECRLWGGDRGIHFYSTNVADAINALHTTAATEAHADLLARLEQLRDQEAERADALAECGPDTLLHGDLWPSNVVLLGRDAGVQVRLIDWDETAAGPYGYDLSTLLLRFEPSYRPVILDAYRNAVDRLAGWELPAAPKLDVILETAGQARLASLLVWSIAAASGNDSGWLEERLLAIVAWLDEVTPVMP
jgi:aminoglycoside phosphotransferase (APT) family kinase protein